ncbi:MAG: A/G-specific adenine glycosylase [Tepidiformaceae bacterium]
MEPRDAKAFRTRLMRWYRANGRHDLSWRLTRDPYAVLVSEVMLQQTQVDRVLPYFERWMGLWPTLGALAEASAAKVIREWAGLGYNRRALGLQRLAQTVSALPVDLAELRTLPGIGPYTASAIACFARGERVVVADTNIARVVARVELGAPDAKAVPVQAVMAAAEALLPRRDARAHNLALMDLGAMVCTARSPKCERCPVRALCAWRASGYPVVERVPRSAERFEESARYARGRIVDALRLRPMAGNELSLLLPAAHRERLRVYLAALERDGMIERLDGEVWALPGDQGRTSMASPKL